MKFRKLDYDPLTGITTYHGYDHQNKKTIIKHEKDTSQINTVLDANKRNANDHKFKFLAGKDDGDGLRHVARLDPFTIQQWLDEGIDVFDQNDWPKVKKRLNDPEYRYLRTSSEHI